MIRFYQNKLKKKTLNKTEVAIDNIKPKKDLTQLCTRMNGDWIVFIVLCKSRQ